MNRGRIRMIIREELEKILQDDVVFKHQDVPGVLDSFDDLDGQGSGRNLSYGHAKSTDHEGRSTKKQLYYIFRKAQSLYDMIEDNDDLPEWVQSKVSRAADKIQSAYDYIEYKIHTGDY